MKKAATSWGARFIRNILLWLLPAAIVWMLITPFYNRFLTVAVQNLVRLTEHPAVTHLVPHETNYLLIERDDYRPHGKGFLHSIRTTDTHFNLVLLGAFFLAVPGIPWQRKLANLGWAVLIAIFFHIFSLFVEIKFVYATQLGAWSAARYGPVAQNSWGILKQLMILPFRFALPFALWAGFYFPELLSHLRLPPPTTRSSV
ncbi:MAG TPA: hypothetical protein VKA53_02070 [Thermoanaerobaculia bacterium]|nr:hypothetical protein [Thermoanaerobaculia bacterium]